MTDKAVTLTETTFDEHLTTASTPVLVDFWAEWCGPCKALGPVIDQLADELSGKLEFAKLNTDDNLGVSRRYDVMSIPTLILFSEGIPKLRLVGARSKDQLLQELTPFI